MSEDSKQQEQADEDNAKTANESPRVVPQCGEPSAQCGEPSVQCGEPGGHHGD